jgi:Pyridoxamine 5'-phosphate oxidase
MTIGTATPTAVRPGRTSHLTTDRVWHELERRSFAVLGHVTPDGEPRSSGIVYAVTGRRLFVAVAPDSLKARQLSADRRVSLTVLVRRGGLLSLLLPIPPATITFEARVVVHPAGSVDIASLSPKLVRLLPDERKTTAVILELVPEGRFLTFGIGVSLSDMRDPVASTARVPVE